MAQIELLPRKEFKITLDSGEVVQGRFGTWALKRFSQKRNYTLFDIEKALSNPTIDDAVELVLSAVEQHFREQKKKESFPYNDIDMCAWIDEMGGMGSDDFARLFNHASDTEKKSEEIAEVQT
jgi:hypothetical protein